MPKDFFKFKHFTIYQDRCAMKVCTDGCLFGAWTAQCIKALGLQQGTMLDIGAGTGLLSLMAAQINNLQIDLIEINAMAAGQALENCSFSPWSNQLIVHHLDVRDYKPVLPYHFIISNPPFNNGDLQSTKEPKNQAHHSGALTLRGLLTLKKKWLRKEGYFFLLFPYRRWKELQEEVENQGLFLNKIIFLHASKNSPPFRVMVMGSFEKTNPIPLSFYIQDENKEFYPAFTEILKEYYLYL
ncbi:MAG: tRNA1(Val) (adenine(37)-N6)-methyltransferase [Flavisolibacter sp.]